MGQDFRLVAPHARLTMDFRGRLGEMLDDGTAQTLVRLLAIPTRPRIAMNPGRIAPQTAPPRSRSPAQNECGEVSVTVGVKRKGNVNCERASPPRLQKKTRTTSGSCVPNSHPTTFTRLPTEIHQLIFSHTEKVEDVLSLGLVNRHLCDIAREQLFARFFSRLAPWAGQKIVYVGEYTEPNDYPPGLFSDAELETLSTEKIEVYSEYEDEYITMTPSNLYDFTIPGVSKIQERLHEFDFNWAGLLGLVPNEPSYEKAALKYLRPYQFPEYSQYFPQDQPWILRNLTTKQFVRAEAIALKQEFVHGPDIDVVGFGHVILLRICWSSQRARDVDSEKILRGIWAGHCFDITMLAKHQEETGAGEDWTDISDEIANENATIFEMILGSDWRSFLCQPKKSYSEWL
ncbi:F-box domain containing protein [Metarhizium album ARSEF 1941]|uniref:F-box domain containing protein n=1 Tax=Metarhizium album (strain ARSEF 1941) TaxID=1081103 RepID=A0A0B2X6R2_METAS|nr:F-box domain containing protein [Metarhizium album ARSEF 1941]KHO00981.1 F-box domain containing protein [Metarhizium album ARSEF 1941]